MSGRRRDAERREEILRTAAAVFADKGFAGATMLEIARRSRASKETLYAWFGDKDALFETLFLSHMGRITSRGGARDTTQAPEAALRQLGRAILSVTLDPETVPLIRVALAEAARFPRLRAMMGEVMDRRPLAAYLERCREAGLMSFDDALPAARAFVALVQSDLPMRLLYGLSDGWPARELESHVDRAVAMFLKAVAPR